MFPPCNNNNHNNHNSNHPHKKMQLHTLGKTPLVVVYTLLNFFLFIRYKTLIVLCEFIFINDILAWSAFSFCVLPSQSCLNMMMVTHWHISYIGLMWTTFQCMANVTFIIHRKSVKLLLENNRLSISVTSSNLKHEAVSVLLIG